MQLIKKQERLGDIVFYLGIAIHLLIMVVGYGEWSMPYAGRLMQVAFALFCLKILVTCYTKTEWAVMIVLGIVGALSYLSTGNEYVVSVAVMIFAAKNTDMRRVCKWIWMLAVLFTIGTAILSLCGIGGIPVDIRDYGRGGVEARWCLGFGHANNIHGTLWYIVALMGYLFFDKMDWRHYLALAIGNFVLFYFTVSKGGMLAVFLVVIALVLLRYIKPLMNMGWIYICGVLGTVGVFVLSLVSVSVEWNRSSILLLLDRIFTGRINLAYQHAHISTWRMLASAGEFGDTVDNGWVTVFFNYGYVIGIVFFLFHLYLFYRTYKEKNGVLLTILLTCVFYTFMETTYTMNDVYLLSNPAYLVAMIFMAGKKEWKDESKQFKA